MDLFFLFAASFVAATLLPTASEVLLYSMLQGPHPPWLLWAVATLGNTLGSVLNYGLGMLLWRMRHARFFPCSAVQLEKAQARFARWGVYGLLLAWVPIIGDPLTVVAGVMRVRFAVFLSLVALGKGLRYAFVLGLCGLMQC
jgi:membrane protein YqaA with SNARE-associated domain